MEKRHISEKYRKIIVDYCLQTRQTDAISIANAIMDDKEFRMHGPEHHFLVAAAMMTAYDNYIGAEQELEQQLAKLYYRTSFILEGSCGFYGVCGNVLGIGAFFSLLQKITPFSKRKFQELNECVLKCQMIMAAFEGPRCCKRATYACMSSAIKELNMLMHISLPLPKVKCQQSYRNEGCHGDECPYFG